MEELTLSALPAWIPGIVMLFTAYIWIITRKQQIRMDSRIIAVTLIGWGILYLIAWGIGTDENTTSMTLRVLMSRLIICFICLSQSLPMAFSYYRSILRQKGVEDG